MTDYTSGRKALWMCITALPLLVCSCSGSGEFYRRVDGDISAGDYLSAVGDVRKNNSWYGDKSSVLYNLDMGLLFHYAGEYDSSTAYLFKAEREIEDLYTKSISQQALSFVVNDNILPYEGEEFEKALVNVFLALNYAKKGMTDDALVEARKVDLKLREYARKYDGKNTYKEDAFIRYIAGMLYESDGEINDAFISYRKAFDTYITYEREYGTRRPSFLLDDLVRTATMLGFAEEAEQYRLLGGQQWTKDSEDDGYVVVIVYAGKSPIKTEERPTISIPDSSGTIHTFQAALPRFVSRHGEKKLYAVSAVTVSDTTERELELGENITEIARKALDERLSMIYLKSGGRALIKFFAAEKMKSEIKKGKNTASNIFGSLAVDLVVGATERADIRGWRTLPSEIQFTRLRLRPGSYNVQISDLSGGGRLKTDTVEVSRGKASFIIVNDLR